MGDRVRVLLIVPCLNEAGSIGPLLGEIHAQANGCDVLVVDDGSTDGTHRLVRPPAHYVRLPANLGIGGAVQAGIQFAEREQYDFCVQIDGDGQHPPELVDELVQEAIKTSSQLVIGSRYLAATDGFQSTAMRRLGSRIIGRTIHLCFGGARITDPTSGLRVMDRRAIIFFAHHYPTDFPEPVSIAWGLTRGFRVREVAVRMRERQAGISSIRLMKTVSYMVRVVSYVLLARFTILPGEA
jgi:glycosyltransferase involved in cell wall biosynthesis